MTRVERASDSTERRTTRHPGRHAPQLSCGRLQVAVSYARDYQDRRSPHAAGLQSTARLSGATRPALLTRGARRATPRFRLLDWNVRLGGRHPLEAGDGARKAPYSTARMA